MLKVNVNNKHSFTVELEKGTVNGQPLTWDIAEIKEGRLHVIKNNKSYNVDVVKADHATKTFVIRVNGNNYSLSVKDKFDELLKSLGMDNALANKINEVKAPMPGMVLDIRVSEGETIKKGDAILVLEAMKMENILKSPADGTIKKIQVKKGVAVEKNQVMITFN